MNKDIELTSSDPTKPWADAWCCALGAGGSADDANICATLAAWAWRDAGLL